ncbi:MAG: glycosyltransferase [Pyrinomonadaceae bacterium]
MNTISSVEKPKLSIVLASQNALESTRDCLSAIQKQSNGSDVEIVVVDNSTDKTAEIIKSEFPEIRLVEADNTKLIPELWAIGINESSGEYVALTTTHFVPSETWIASIFKAHEQPYAGIGGAIENDERAGAVAWAVYFCRYSPYMLPFDETEVEDFAADNASYKRRDLDRVKESMRNGFWETFVHKEMRAVGMSLLKSPKIIVYHQKSFTLFGFMNQRFWHGKQFGSARAAAVPGAKRIALVLLSPLIPFLYLYRITGRVVGRRRNIHRYILSLPILILFLVSWSLGEFTGYLRKS